MAALAHNSRALAALRQVVLSAGGLLPLRARPRTESNLGLPGLAVPQPRLRWAGLPGSAVPQPRLWWAGLPGLAALQPRLRWTVPLLLS